MADKEPAAKKAKKSELQQKSPAEFFAENKNIAGFDNPGKCLYTTIRELVENALDSAESISNLPLIDITIEEVSKARLDRIRGLEYQERLDERLYHDYETGDQKKKRQAKEQREVERMAKAAIKKGESAPAAASNATPAVGAGLADKPAGGGARAKTTQYYKVTVKDNGSGMPHSEIPDMLGRVLSGTKYGVKQTRGKFGLGAKMALIWSKMTTGLPFDILSARPGSKTISHYVLDIDIHKNAPNVHKCELLPNPEGWHGAALSITIEGNWTTYRPKIIKYLRQIAVITPYAEFQFFYRADSQDEKAHTRLVFRRRTDVMPAPPAAIKHHPSSVDLELVKRLAAVTKHDSLVKFLMKDFDCINKDLAGRLVDEMRDGVRADTSPSSLTSQQLARLHRLLREAKFADPKGTHLSPAGEYNLRLGVMKELRPELIATHQGDVRVFEGHGFIVEAAVSIGGRDVKPGINVFRFANRIPLLFEGGSDVVTRTAQRIKWSDYKISQATDKVGVFVSIVSTKIPFKGAGKEYVGDDIEEMVAAVKSALTACCRQLKAKIQRALVAREQKQRKNKLTKYIPNVCNALWEVLQVMAERPALPGAKRQKLEEQSDLLSKVALKEITASDLTQHLTRHIERIDTDLALEFQVQQGLAGAAKEDVWLGPATTTAAVAAATGTDQPAAAAGRAALVRHAGEVHTNTAVLRLLLGPGDERWMPEL